MSHDEAADRLALNLREVNENAMLQRIALTQEEVETRTRLLAQCVTFDERLL